MTDLENQRMSKRMLPYIGTKMLFASTMNRADYNTLRGWDLPKDEDGTDEGYLVKYEQDKSRTANVLGFDGYISWSPVNVFEASYDPLYNMTFGHAIEMLKRGHRVQRAGWNGKGMWIVLMTATSLPCYNTQDNERKVNDRTAKFIGLDTPLNTGAYIAMWGADKIWQPGWLPSQPDLLSNDWCLISDDWCVED